MKHMWECEHSYYAADGNYFSNECHAEHATWAAFMSEEGDSDLDYNLIYRWDWSEDDSPFNGDVYYRNGTLKLFYIGQRKALARSVHVSVCRADEPAVRTWLQPRLQHLASLWMPLTVEAAP